jgi:crossover junction endodeoxyribonuclease RuvC
MRLLGLDPGLRHTGWGVIEARGNALTFLACGVVDSRDGEELARRLGGIYHGLSEVIRAWLPAEAAVEETVVNKNPLTSLKLGHARGVVMLAASHAGLPVSEYASSKVKKAVTGTGGAAKEQVQAMVRFLLPGCREVKADACDALAVAICHAHLRASHARVALAVERSSASVVGRA